MLMLSQLDADISQRDIVKMLMKSTPITSIATATIIIPSLSLKMVKERNSKVKQVSLRTLFPTKEDMSKMIVTMVPLAHILMGYMITSMRM